jgi:hypothetical protein
MNGAEAPARLYLVTPVDFDPEPFAALAARALAAHGVACLRLDLGAAPEEQWRVAANHLLPVAHAHDVALVIADHHRLVAPLGLDGVHLTASRTPIREVRKALGPDRIVGAFAGTSRHIAITLAEAGADYVALGPVGETGALGDPGGGRGRRHPRRRRAPGSVRRFRSAGPRRVDRARGHRGGAGALCRGAGGVRGTLAPAPSCHTRALPSSNKSGDGNGQ